MCRSGSGCRASSRRGARRQRRIAAQGLGHSGPADRASGNSGADALAKASDGHTIGVINNGPLTSSKFLNAKLPYDPLKDFAPIITIGTAPLSG